MRRALAVGVGLLAAMLPITAAEARTPSKGKAERFLEKRFGNSNVDGVQTIGANATCVRPRSIKRSNSTRCVIQIQRADGSTCEDNRVLVKYRKKKSNRMVVRGFNPECRDAAPQPEIPTDTAPPGLPPGPPPVTGGPPPGGAPSPPAAQSADRSLKQATFLYCTNWEVDPWYQAYYIYACFYDLGFNFQADIYYYYGDASQGAYWFSLTI